MADLINEHREAYGVESIFNELPIGPSTYYRAVDLNSHTEKRSDRAKIDESLSEQIMGVWEKNYQVYGDRKV